ncbi:nuclear pore complex protein DDB_G0274915-like isoform X3 [Periplaneta americana]|uniref:nuclear pore complex protein DDB_G0274915-like isoform X3 n=1 Tax=Periplaneta americana TaxID=6978 RepID=UPI0037E9BC49
MGSRQLQKCVKGVVAAITVLAFLQEPCEGQQRRARVSTSGAAGQQAVEFDCPEEFGYYPHPNDCTQYYVCVFGGALLESCTGGLMYSHELQTCDWPRNVGCGAEGESATISTVRVTDPRTRHTTPTGSPSRTVPVSRGQQQQREQQQRQQQEEIAKHQLYADDLGPAEEVENDRQQRVYRGQPSTVGQVARDRDGLRHQVTNAIPAPPGRVASGEKIGVISFGTQHQQQQQQQQQYSFDELTLDNNLLTTNETRHGGREKRQVRYRFPGQGGPVLPIARPGQNTFSSLNVPVPSNGANYNSYQTFGSPSNNPAPVPLPPPAPRPSNPAPPPSSDNDYRPILNANIPNTDIRHFRSPENYLTSGQRPPPNIPFTQTNNNFKPRPPQTPNPVGSVYNLRQYLAQPSPAPSIELRPQQPSPIPLGLDLRQQQQPPPLPNLNIQQQNVNNILHNLNQNGQYLNPAFSISELDPTSFTNFQQNSEIYANPSATPGFISLPNHQQQQSQNQIISRDPATPGIIYQNPNAPQEENYSYLLFDRPNTAAPPIQYTPSSTVSPPPAQQVPFQNYATTLRTLPAGQNSLGFPHDTLSFDEIHKHEQRETSHHLVPPPPPLPQQTEAPHFNSKQHEIKHSWQKLLREQQQQQDEDWSPLPHSTEPVPPAYNEHRQRTHAQSQKHEDQAVRPQVTPQTQTEGPFRPNTNPYGDDGGFVGVLYKDNERGVSDRPRLNPDLYTKLPSTVAPTYSSQQHRHQNNEYLRPLSTSQNIRQPNIPNENLTEKPHRNVQRPQNQAPAHTTSNTRNVFPAQNDGSQAFAHTTSNTRNIFPAQNDGRQAFAHTTSNTRNVFPAQNDGSQAFAHTTSNTRNVSPAQNDGSQTFAVQNHDVVLHSDTTSTPYQEYESVKLPVQSSGQSYKPGKPQTNDYQEEVYDDRRPQNYDDKSYYDDEVLEEERQRFERPETVRRPETNSGSQNYNRGNTQVETRYKDERQPYYKASQNEKPPQSYNREPQRQSSSEEAYEGNHDSQKLPHREQSTSQKESSSNEKRPTNQDKDAHVETVTEDRFPSPPPEFFEDLNKYKNFENPFANLDFDFDEYLDKLRGKQSSSSQENPSTVRGNNNEHSEVNYYQTENDSIKSTTQQNPVTTDEVTTTRRPRIRQRPRTTQSTRLKPRKRPTQTHTTEYIKEYYPPQNSENAYNQDASEGKETHREELEDQRKNNQGKPDSTNVEIAQDVFEKDQSTSTTRTPYSGVATAVHPANPNPLTVPFYSGEDGNFYANPVHIHSQRPVENQAEGLKVHDTATLSPEDAYYKYSLEEENAALYTSERNPLIVSTTQPHAQRVNNQESYESIAAPGINNNAHSLHPILEVVTVPAQTSKPPRRGPLRRPEENVERFPQNFDHDYTTKSAVDVKVPKNSYYEDSLYHQQEVTTQSHTREKVNAPTATPLPSSIREQPHPFTATTASSNIYKYHDSFNPSTELTPPKPLVEPVVFSTKPKKIGQLHNQGLVEENDTIKPLRNERIPENHRPITTTTYTPTIPSTTTMTSTTTEYLTTSSTIQYDSWDSLNNWQSTTPYQKGNIDVELTTPTQPNYKISDKPTGQRFNSDVELTTSALPDYTTVKLPTTHVNHKTTTPIIYAAIQTSTRPSNELLDSIYDIAKTMFHPQSDVAIPPHQAGENVYFEPSSEHANQNPVTEFVLVHHANGTTTTIPTTTRLKPRRRRPINKTPRPFSNPNAEYTTSNIDLSDHTTPETYTIRRRPSKDHPSSHTRHRVRRPQTTPLPSTSVTPSLPSNDVDVTFSTTVKSPSYTRSKPPVTSRRQRRPTKTRINLTSTEAQADNDKSESFDRPLQDNANRLNRKPLPEKDSIAPTSPHRVEPSVAPVTYVQQQPAVQAPASQNVYNNSQRYDPTNYDPYYNLYDEDVELYRDVADYSQYNGNQGSRQTNANSNNQQPAYRGQSPYKQAPQAPPQEPQRNAAYAQPSYNNQQDVYVQNIDPQEYNENYNTATDDQAQYNQQAAARQPNKSPTRSDRNELNFAPQTSSTTSTTIPPTTTITTTTTTLRTTTAPSTTTTTTTVVPPRQQTRLREDPTTTTNTNKYNAVLAAIATSSPNERPSVRTTTTHFPSIPDFDTPYLLTLQDSTAQPSSRQASTTLTNTVSRQRDTQQPKSRRITLTSAISLDDPFSTAAKSNQPSRSRGSPQRISIDLSTETATGRRGSEVISLSAPLSGTSRANPPSRGQEGNARRTATKSFTVIDNTDSNNKAFSLDAEIKAIENSFAQNSGQRRGEERSRGSSSRSDSTRTQNQRGSVEPVQRARLVSDTAASPNNVRAPQDSSSSRNPATPPRTPQARQPETPSPRSAPEVTTRSSPRTASNEIVSSPSIRISSTSRGSEAQKEPPPTSSPSALRSSYRASLVEPDDVHSGLSRNSIVQQSDVPTNARTRSRGGSQRKPTSCADAVDSNSNAGCDEKPQIRVRPTTASPDSQSTPAPARGNNNAGRTRGGSSYTTAPGAEPTVNRGTPASVSRSRPTLKPSTAIVSKAQEFVDIYRYPPSRPDPVYPTPQVDKTAAKCRKDVCLLPDCYCGGKDIPGDLPAEEVPQIVLLTFDDAINDLNKGLYQDIFEKGRTNPNGCPITATFYVSHEWTDYSQVQNLYSDGHEMASHSISHSFGEQFSQKKWTKEIAGQREILAAYGGVHLEDIRGMRAPFLAIGGNKMFKMLYDSNFTYDSSMPVYENRPPSWPYTLDYKIFHDCMIPPCPTRSYPGVWEVPMVMWQDLNGGRCSMGDACSNPPTSDGVYKMLIKNFERHYTTNRAPFGLFYHAAWFTQPHHKEGFIAFLDTIVNMQDVWLVTNWQAIQWVRDPTPLSRVNNFPPFQCNYPERPRRCNNPKVCNLWHKSGVRYMRTCQPCPDVYPWTGKTGVKNSKVDNEIIEES